MVFEGIPGGPMDCWKDVKTPEQHLERSSKWILDTFLPWEAERCRNVELTDANGILAGRFPPTVRKPVARLPSGEARAGPGRCGRASTIRSPGKAPTTPPRRRASTWTRIVAHGDRPFDAAFMQADVRRLLGLCAVRHRLDQRDAAAAAAACAQHSGRGAEQAEGRQGVRQRFRQSAHFFPWLADPGEAEKFIAAA